MLEAMLDSLLYGAEVWGCYKQTDALEQPGPSWGLAAELKFGLQYDMMMLPLIWQACGRSVAFWVKMMRMEEKRIVRMLALEPCKCRNKAKLG